MSGVKLTRLSHGGGCGCKIAPSVLERILSDAKQAMVWPDLLVGSETSDDAAVYRINDRQAIVATTDFFMPIVDDAYDFGRIAATNALSDIYAMGATPLMALAIVGMPVATLPEEDIRRILAGGADVCRDAGIPVAGGHSIDSPEPIYGLVALGIVDPDLLKRNSSARAGDVLILGKPLGVGILSQAMKKGRLDEEGYAALLATTTQLNKVGTALSGLPEVHALTDVTGFGLLGHLLEVCRGAQVSAHLDMAAIPLIPGVQALAEEGIGPGAIARNLDSFGGDFDPAPAILPWQRNLLADPQTSGGLLVAVAPEAAAAVLSLFQSAGFARAAVIGRLEAGRPRVHVV